MKIVLGIEYHGAGYHGWQRQPSRSDTIQAHLEQALEKVSGGHPVATFCAGRTDAGVHATQQIIHFQPTIERPVEAWLLGSNQYLPNDIRILWARQVDDSFHARYLAQARFYRYIIYNAPIHSALYHHAVCWFNKRLNVDTMRQATQYLIGKYDFSSFRASGCQAKSPIKTIETIHVQQQSSFIIFDFKADAFLYHMIRNIIGVLLEIGTGKKPVEWAKDVLAAHDRSQAGKTASAHGLYFLGATYPQEYDLPASPKLFYPLINA